MLDEEEFDSLLSVVDPLGELSAAEEAEVEYLSRMRYEHAANAAGNGRVETEYAPDGATTIRSFAADGTLLSVTGTAVHGQRYEYGVEQVDTSWRAYTKTVLLDHKGQDTGEWSTEYLDALGRNDLTVYPDGGKWSREYDAFGELVKQIDPDGVIYPVPFGPAGRGANDRRRRESKRQDRL